jgi:hypothetical protein
MESSLGHVTLRFALFMSLAPEVTMSLWPSLKSSHKTASEQQQPFLISALDVGELSASFLSRLNPVNELSVLTLY